MKLPFFVITSGREWQNSLSEAHQIFRLAGKNDHSLGIVSIIERTDADRVPRRDEFSGITVKKDQCEFRVHSFEHFCSVFKIQRKDDLTVAAALERIPLFPQHFPLFFESVKFTVADHITAVQLKGLHAFRVQAHDLQPVESQQAFAGIHDPAVIRSPGFCPSETFFKCFSVGASTAISHN